MLFVIKAGVIRTPLRYPATCRKAVFRRKFKGGYEYFGKIRGRGLFLKKKKTNNAGKTFLDQERGAKTFVETITYFKPVILERGLSGLNRN